jgi:hypothetical protein
LGVAVAAGVYTGSEHEGRVEEGKEEGEGGGAVVR